MGGTAVVTEADIGKKVEAYVSGMWYGGTLTDVGGLLCRVDCDGVVVSAEKEYVWLPAVVLAGGAPPKNTPNPKQAYGAQKPDMSLVPQVGLLHCAYAMEDGAKKYGPYNWRDDPVEARTYVAAAMRHLACWLDGEERTADTNVSNLGAVMACCAILLDAQSLGVLIDNRPKAGAASKVADEIKAEKVAKAASK
jgi:hypothetical protein